MLNTKNTQSEIAVRLYDNQKFGTTYGKGLYRKAIYNGTIDTKDLKSKYLVDFYSYADWANLAKTDAEMEILANVSPEADTLFSWIKHYDFETRVKASVPGMCRINMNSLELVVLICDEQRGLTDQWELGAKPCKQTKTDKPTPQLLATNGDLHDW